MNDNDITAALALTSDYDRLAIVDAETGRVLGDRSLNIFSSHVEGDFERLGYDGQLNSFIEQLVVDEDKNKVRISMEPGLITTNLYTNKAHYVNYRVCIDGKVREYQTKFCRMPSSEGSLLAVGTCDMSAPLSEYLHRVDTARRRAETINDEKNRFLHNLSHDIKAPLNGVIGMMEAAKRNISDIDKVSRYLESMESQSSHLQSLLNDVMDISSLEDNHVSIIRQPMNMTIFSKDCVAVARESIQDKNVNLTTEFPAFEHPYVLGDKVRLQKVIVSILDNAIKFTRDGDIIFFRIFEKPLEDKKVEYKFEIEDTGIGMRPEFLEHIFDPFAQEFKGSETADRGSGLGLTITKKLVDLMGGRIKVRSSQGIGSKFTITLAFDIDEETEEALKEKR
ncbi:MAG: HAMP domain-containing histidine kinase [Lachnospiraceae bacterium]|nr:HAMP domain-containing histidine kinase [Lachnospiraceae bacterium]